MQKKVSFKTVDEYFSKLPDKHRAALDKIRSTIKVIVPDAEEVISYQIPTFKLNGKGFAAIAGFKDHLSYFPFGKSAIELLKEDLKGYETSAGTIRFPIDKPLPKALIKKLVFTKIAENEQKLLAKKTSAPPAKKKAVKAISKQVNKKKK